MLNLVTLPLVGQTDLSFPLLLVFAVCFLAVVGFEFVNGFHDTANAVATVIYTKALRPVAAIPWSGFCNFLGVLLGGVAVAMGILKLLPLNDLMILPVKVGACFVLAVLLGSIIWNLGTWYLGIPCSSSHTLIGAMIGASLAFGWYYGGSGVNWTKAEEIGSSLILSPIIGFGAAMLLMYLLKNVFKAAHLFHVPAGENDRPPFLTRVLLITTCTLVSFFHGSNDGQKGVGLLMLILIAFVPAQFAVNKAVPDAQIVNTLQQTRQIVSHYPLNGDAKKLNDLVAKTEATMKDSTRHSHLYQFRRQLQDVIKAMGVLHDEKNVVVSKPDQDTLKKLSAKLDHVTDFAPIWVIMTISLSLGFGTMIGWRRIVVTIGEKIGQEHLNYAQGATAEIVAASTIGLSTGFGLPVSTTHVLSSGIAGAMVASGGKNNLNNATIKSIAMAWVLTLPVAIGLSFVLFMLFHLFI